MTVVTNLDEVGYDWIIIETRDHFEAVTASSALIGALTVASVELRKLCEVSWALTAMPVAWHEAVYEAEGLLPLWTFPTAPAQALERSTVRGTGHEARPTNLPS